jgi:hypothetical protein
MPIVWVVLGVVIMASAVLAGRRPRAVQVGLLAVSALYLAAGAAVNAAYLITGDDYRDFAAGSSFAFVRDTWVSLVVPHHHLFIGALVVFELTVGVLVLMGPGARELGLVSAIVFHVLLVSFAWAIAFWSVPMIVALVLLLRAARGQRAMLAGWGAPAPRRTSPGV